MQVAANGQSLFCRIEGAAAGPWVVLSHSLATNHHIWDDQVPALAGRYRILRYDVRGHGDSRASPGDYDFEQLGADVIALMDAHDIEKCHFIGISLGGMTALGLGINHGDRLHSISVCAAQAKFQSPPSRRLAIAFGRFWTMASRPCRKAISAAGSPTPTGSRVARPSRNHAKWSLRHRPPGTPAVPPPSAASTIWTGWAK